MGSIPVVFKVAGLSHDRGCRSQAQPEIARKENKMRELFPHDVQLN
jgi:hypothetical protein